jgi:hypothetical protein
MSYTLRGRLETRLASLVLPLAAACIVAGASRDWWPVELAAVMVAVGLVFDVAYHPLLAYQPGWYALPLGLLELGAVMAVVLALGIPAPLATALALFAAAWVVAQILGHAMLPLWRLSYAEDGGELGRSGVALAGLVAAPLLGSLGLWWANLPPTVHLSAGVHRGPLVVDRRERLVGERGAVVLGGIVVRHRDVTISHLTVVGGENGIDVNGYHGVHIDHVTVRGARMDGIHVRLAPVTIKHCFVDMRGAPLGQGIDISYNAEMGESLVERCTVVGGREGIVTHSSTAMLKRNHVEGTAVHGIAMTEMSMGGVERNTVRNARGVGILCGDRSMCMLSHNDVAGTRDDSGDGNRLQAGLGIEVEFWAEAELDRNEVSGNPVPLGVFLSGRVSSRR